MNKCNLPKTFQVPIRTNEEIKKAYDKTPKRIAEIRNSKIEELFTPEVAVLPYNEYIALLPNKAAEEGFDSVEDLLDYNDAVQVLQTDTERIPYEEVLRQRGL